MNKWFNTESVGFFDIAVHGNDGWFCNIFFSALFHIDLLSLKIDFVAQLPADDICEKEMYGPIEYYSNMLLIAPTGAKNIIVFYLETNEIKLINISEYIGTDYVNAFQKVIFYKDAAYFIPGRSKKILRLQLDDFSVKAIDYKYDKCMKTGWNEKRWIISDACLDGDVLYMTFWQDNVLLKYDIAGNAFDTVEVKDLGCLSSCTVIGKDIYITDRDKPKLAVLSGEKQIVYDLSGKISCERGIYRLFVNSNHEEMIPVPYRGKQISALDNHFENPRVLMEFPEDYEEGLLKTYPDNVRCCKLIDEETVLFYSLFDNTVVKLNLGTGKTNIEKSIINSKDRGTVIRHYEDAYYNRVVTEAKGHTLNDFISYIEGK